MPPGGSRGSIAVVFVDRVEVDLDLEDLDVPVVAVALPPLVIAALSPAELDADALSVFLSLDVVVLDCAVDNSSLFVVLAEDDWELLL